MDHAFRLIVFDFDGTLVDSQAMIGRCMSQAFAEAGLSAPELASVRRIVGLSLEIAIERLLPEGEGFRAAEIAGRYRKAFFALRSDPAFHEPLFPRARETLDRLAAAEVHLAIATGKNLRGLRASLDRHGLSNYFSCLQTPDTSPSKPHPGMLYRAIEELDCTASETVVIGDTTYDMEMARNAGATGIGVGWGYHEVAELKAAGAVRVLQEFTDLPLALAGLSGGRG
jgi:phosphoglycolate phosphatase